MRPRALAFWKTPSNFVSAYLTGSIERQHIQLFFNAKPLQDDEASLDEYYIKEGSKLNYNIMIPWKNKKSDGQIFSWIKIRKSFLFIFSGLSKKNNSNWYDLKDRFQKYFLTPCAGAPKYQHFPNFKLFFKIFKLFQF